MKYSKNPKVNKDVQEYPEIPRDHSKCCK